MPAGKEAQAARPPRVIRVFVSSTFRDMHDEREELIKRVFPQLRKLCESRGVIWGEVDLRWGLPDEAKAEGKVLPICLAEIHRCRPFFIGLLGERYGWVPDEIPQYLIAQEPWLQEHLHHSVTELEILHGVLNNPEMADHAFFYFRDPSYAASRPPDKQADFTETPSPEEIARFGPEEAQRRAEERRGKLAALKERLRRSGLPLEENYLDPKDLGQLVLWDLTAVIDCLFPEGSQPDPLDREAAAHEAYALSRAVVEVRPGEFSGVYIGRDEYLKLLDAHARGDGPPLVVLGESGIGKSALLANWALGFRPRHPQDHMIMHFIGAGPHSADWATMLRRLMGELQRRFDIPQDIPDQPDALRLAFANFLSMAAAQGRVVIVIDALNQLEDRDGAPDLVWLPPVIPANVRLILSTLPGRSLEDLKKRGWMEKKLTIEPWEEEERLKFIFDYLKQYTKELSCDLAARAAAADPSANPLYLRTLLEEMRVYGDHDTLCQRLEYYLMADKPAELFEKILERWEADYDRDRHGLVSEAMTLISAARRGLSQAELLELLGKEGEPLPAAVWAPLHLAAEHALMDRAGLISFGHDYFRQAVGDRYLATEARRQAAHLRLADYFDQQDLETGDRPNLRKIDELPWQLARAKSWTRLYDLLKTPDFLDRAWIANKYDIKEYWAFIEQQTTYRIIHAYRPYLECPEKHKSILNAVDSLLEDTGYWNEVIELREKLCKHYRGANDVRELVLALNDLARVLTKQANLDRALSLYNEGMDLAQSLDANDILQSYLFGMAMICKERGELGPALALLMEEEAICREITNNTDLMKCFQNQSSVYRILGEYEMALSLLKQLQKIALEYGNLDAYQGSLGECALVMELMGRHDEGMILFKEQEYLCRRLGNIEDLAACLGNQARIHLKNHNTETAANLYRQQEEIALRLGSQRLIFTAHMNRALLFLISGDFIKAQTLLKPAIRFFEANGMKHLLAQSLKVQGFINAARGEFSCGIGTLIAADIIGAHAKSPIARLLQPKKNLDYQEFASRYLRKAVQRGFSDAETSQRLGRVLECLGLADRAIQAYRKALELRPGLTDVQVRLASLIIEKEMDHEQGV